VGWSRAGTTTVLGEAPQSFAYISMGLRANDQQFTDVCFFHNYGFGNENGKKNKYLMAKNKNYIFYCTYKKLKSDRN
jgi:hypothetical protein